MKEVITKVPQQYDATLSRHPLEGHNGSEVGGGGNAYDLASVVYRKRGAVQKSRQVQIYSSRLYPFSGNRAFVIGGEHYQYVRQDGVWKPRGILTHPLDPEASLGSSTALDGRRLLAVEVPGESTFLFELIRGVWQATADLQGANDLECRQLGFRPRLALVQTLAVAACPAAATRPHPIFEGRVLVYELPPLLRPPLQ